MTGLAAMDGLSPNHEAYSFDNDNDNDNDNDLARAGVNYKF